MLLNLCVFFWLLQGFIANITDRGCFVRFLGRLTGLANIPQVLRVSHFRFYRVKSSVQDENRLVEQLNVTE
jgi:hypothetical protein